ncbi:Hypothetical predicted protein [Mytilus galloprovincialis]|uniref:DNA-directed DNA polymerase n=1 Tax=Mytilus galloprovincialis TaxID=29158 RepID=A0A8B6G162_MYTGA|nr:Hypothetical predicted protein [Mytilus galloprovincialis]
MDGERDTSQPYFASKTYTLLSKNDSSEMDINEAFQKQFKSFDVYIARGSGWTLKHVIRIEIQTLQYRPIGGSNYFPLPESLQRSHSVVNIRNDDQKCFLWSILAHLHPAECNPNRIAHYTAYENELDMTGITYPVQLKHIPKFENQNDVAVNVLGFENEQLFPMYVSEHKDKKYKVDLLYITGGDKAHYCYIKHFNRLMSRTVNSGRAYKFCRYCLRGCTSQKVLEKHLKYCSQHKAQFFEFPTKGDGDIVKFEDFAKTMMVLFVIYCDFEAFSQKIDTCIPNPSTSNTTTMIDFEACGYGYKVVCCVDERYTKPTVIYRGPKASEHFFENILKEEKYIRDILDVIEPMQMTAEDEAAFQNSTHCSLCGDMFTKKTEFPSSDERNLLLRKGVYPYGWVDGESKFNETCLPPKDAFYNDLTKSHISDEDYNHAKDVWSKFHLKKMGEYHDLYMKCDVLQLTDVFERFRYECKSNYGLDPAHFYTSPGLAWSAALKVTKCKLELITDDIRDAYLFIESGMRGGISQISNRYAAANNKYIPKTYDSMKESSYLIYQDCNNLYGLAMSMPLPTGKFRFLRDNEQAHFNISDVDLEGEKGYILEVDLDYPEDLHDSHSDYPLAPERKSVEDENISPYCRDLWEKMSSKINYESGGKKRPKIPKLLCTLEHKRNYVCHIRNLKLYMKLGLKLKKVHRILEFSQSSFLKEYIDLNTKRRQEAKGEFQKSFFKLMNNAVFGKTMENIRKRVNVELIHTKKKLLKVVAKPSFERCEIFNGELVGVQCRKTVLNLNKPITVGMCVL